MRLRFRSALPFALTLLALSALAACGDDERTPIGVLDVSLASPTVEQAQYIGRDVTLTVSASAAEGTVLPEEVRFEYDWDFGDGSSALNAASTIDHVYTTPESYTVTMTVRALEGDELVAEGEARGIVNVFGLAELAIDNANVLAENPVGPNDTFRVTADVVNTGLPARTSFDVTIFLGNSGIDPEAPPSAAQLQLYREGGLLTVVTTETIEAVFDGPNGRTLIDLQTLQAPEGLPNGEYSVLVYADTGDTVGETDEDNNGAFAVGSILFEGTARGADLFATNVIVQPARVNQIDQMLFSATIQNSGTETATLFTYTISLSADDTALDDGDLEVARVEVPALAAGESLQIENTILTVDPAVDEVGDYYFILNLDPDNEVQEASDANNTAVSNVIEVTTEEISGIDIRPTALEVTPATTFLGGSLQVAFTVENQGTQGTDRPFLCRFYASEDDLLDSATGGDEVLASVTVDPLEAGGLSTQVFDAFVPEFVAEGTYVPFLLCDAAFLVNERIETNNSIRGEPFTVAGEANVDLVVDSLSLSPLVVANGETVSVSLELCNRGTNGSTPSVVRVYLSEDPLQDADDIVLLQSRVPPIETDACITVQADVPATCATFVSSYSVFAVADDSDLVTEVIEDNNVFELDQDLVIEGLICACEPDSFEPNQTPAAAPFLNPSIGRFTELTMCDVARDYYLIPLLDDQTVRVEARFENDRGNLDMRLFALDLSTVLDASATNGDIEEVAYVRVPRRGNYLLAVEGRTPEDRNVYDLDITVSSPEAGTDLTVLDVTVDDTTPVLGATVETCFDIVNLGDTPAAATLARLYLSDDTRIDPIDDVLLGELAVDAFEDRVSRCLSVVLPDELGGGEKYIGVVADARNDLEDELDETNNAGVSNALNIDATCFDVLEPNNSLDAPQLLTLETAPPIEFAGLLACSDNRDFYELCLSDGDFLTVDVAFDNLIGDIDIKLYDQDGAQVDRSESTGSEERVAVDYVAGDQCYRLEVYVAGRNLEVPYTMTVDTGRAPDELICSRIEEPNDGFGTAAPLRNFLDDCMAVCPVDDEDYYSITLSPGTELDVRLLPVDGEDDVPADLRMTLWGPSRNFLTNTISATEPLTQTIALNGRHFIRVRSNGDGARDQRYCLQVNGVSGVDLVPQDFLLEDAIAAPGDTVRFSFTLANARDQASAPTRYAVYLSPDPVFSPDTDILLREVDVEPLDGLSTRLEGRRFDIPLSIVDGGDYSVILVVDSENAVPEFSESNNIVIAPLFIAPRCLPDLAEPNNFPSDAFDAIDAVDEVLTSCGIDDADWYVFDATRALTEVIVRFEDALGDLDLYVYSDPLQAPIAVSDTITDDEIVTVATTVGETYWIEVRQHTDASTTYRLRLE